MTNRAYSAALITAGLAIAAAPAYAQRADAVSFELDVLPVLQKQCQSCHGAQPKGGLKLDSFQNLMKGGAKGAIVVPGDPAKSKLIQVIQATTGLRMPPTGDRVARADVEKLKKWVEQGALQDGAMETDAQAQKSLQILFPQDGGEVREKVKIGVPMDAIPPEGFIAVYVDGQFRAALAPPSPEEVAEKKMKPDAAVTYTWDSQEALTDDNALSKQLRIAQDGPHLIEVKSFSSDGRMLERSAVQVNLKNSIAPNANQRLKLWYNGASVGQSFAVDQNVNMELTAVQGGVRRAGAGNTATAPGPEKLSHEETARYLVSMEDVAPGYSGFWRQRLDSPLAVVVNNLKNVVRVDASSRHYGINRRGQVQLPNAQMERDKQEPVFNPIDLPGTLHPVNQPFVTNLRLHLGSYIPGTFKIDRLQAEFAGMEWRDGERCAKIRLTYNAGKGKLDIRSLGLSGVDFEVQQGTSTIWFSEASSRVIEAKHEINGTAMVDVAQLGGGGGGVGGPGGDLAPGGGFGSPYPGGASGGGSPYPGSSSGGSSPYGAGRSGPSGGYPGSGGGYPASGGGSSPYGAGRSGPSGGYPGSGGGYPGSGGGYPGSGGGYPGSGGGYPGSGGGYPGSGGGYPGIGGGDTGIAPPTTKRYQVKLTVTTEVVKPGQLTAKN
ncbi:MAG: c-type cytochrome domain-containing protein [Armatimonadota bacterium]